MSTIHAYTSDDARGWLSLLNTMRKHPLSFAQFVERESTPGRPPVLTRLVCKEDGDLVAIGQLATSPYVPEGFARLDMAVSANSRCAGIGSKLLVALEREAIRQKLAGLYCERPDHEPRSLDWLQTRGFKVARKRRESRLLLRTGADVPPHSPRLPPQVRLASLKDSELEREQFLAFVGGLLRETPDLESLPAWAPELLDEIFLTNPGASLDWIILAFDKDRPIGVGVMHKQETDAYIYFLGVLRQFRGRDVGGALLSALVDEARRQRFEAVNIDNLEDNVPALRLTEKLGFQRATTRFELRKLL